MKLLIVVDYQNDFVNGSLGFAGAEKLEKGIIEKIEEYDRVIYTLDTHKSDYLETLEGTKLPVKHCIKGTNGHMLYGKVANHLSKAEAIFEKDTFPSLELANYLKKHPADIVEVCGLVSNICVLSNVIMIKAALPNAKIIVNKNLTDSFDKKLNAETFDILEGLHIEVME